jgi:hypothetical protein
MQRMQVAEALARQLERLGLSRRAQEVADLGTYLAQRRGPGITVGLHDLSPRRDHKHSPRDRGRVTG